MSAQIIFHRGSGWMDRARAYKIVIDGEVCGKLKRNSSLTVDVSAGPHEVTSEIDWCCGNVILVDAKEGDVTEIDVANRHGALRSQFTILSAPDSYLSLVLRQGEKSGPRG